MVLGRRWAEPGETVEIEMVGLLAFCVVVDEPSGTR